MAVPSKPSYDLCCLRVVFRVLHSYSVCRICKKELAIYDTRVYNVVIKSNLGGPTGGVRGIIRDGVDSILRNMLSFVDYFIFLLVSFTSIDLCLGYGGKGAYE